MTPPTSNSERNLTTEQEEFEEETGCCYFCGANPCQQEKNCPHIEDERADD